MNKPNFTHLFALTALVAMPLSVNAKQGAPHTLKAEPNYSTVDLQWCSPETVKELKWHDDEDYNGSQGQSASSQKAPVIYVASDFTPADLALVKGEKITAVKYFEYRPTLSVTALIYEDGKVVREAAIDLKTPAYQANQWREGTFAEPYEITGDKKVRVALRIEHGANLDFTAIMNRYADSRGDLYSYDGKKWFHNGQGTFLVTAVLGNDVDEAPKGYNVYADGKMVNAEPITELSYKLTDQADGTHKYKVEAVYDGASFATPEAQVATKGTASYFAGPAHVSMTTDGVNGHLSWQAPLLRTSDKLTWTNETLQNSIGGTASTNTKVWIKNEFEPADLISFVGAKMTGINVHFHEKAASMLVIWAQKDGAFVQVDTIPADQVTAIEANEWKTLPFSKPVEIEGGAKYAYGYYMMHTPKAHPISFDTGVAVGSKGNSFSTSSPNSKKFESSNPSWKTLTAGGYTGNWMLSANLEGGAVTSATAASYNVYRDGELEKSGVTALECDVEVPAPGLYVYSVEAVGSDGKSSAAYDVEASFKLPDAYRAPLINKAEYDAEAQTVDLEWGMDVELKHYNSISYIAGFDEEMTLSYGARFKADELADYKGFKMTKLNFITGADIPAGFKLQVLNGAGTVLAEEEIPAGATTAQALYSIELSKPVTVSGDEDLILAYNATLPAKTSAIVLDEGPLATGGAVVCLGGNAWLNLGTINSTYNNYNIVIGAQLAEGEEAAAAPSKAVELGVKASGYMRQIELKAADLRAGYGIDSFGKPVAKPRTALKAATYNVYCNGELLASTAARTYSDKLPGYDNYSYTVSAVYPNGWESAQSDPVVIANPIAQKSRAPFDLKLADDHKALVWADEQDAPVLTYAKDGNRFGVGMTGSGTRESYICNKFPADSLAGNEGQLITHIKFALYSTDLKTASIIVVKDFNVCYEQPLDIASLKDYTGGYNVIRLNEPVEITAGDDLMFGYHITYANGVKPMMYDAGPAVDGLGNLMSSSGSATSWKTLKSLNKAMDGNWCVYAFVQMPNSTYKPLSAPAKAEGDVKYNVYCDNTLAAEGLAECKYAPAKLTKGAWTVTSVKEGVESAQSNALILEADLDMGGVNDVVADSEAAHYDHATQTLVVAQGVSGVIVNAAGQKVADVNGPTSMAGQSEGVYFFVAEGAEALKFVK